MFRGGETTIEIEHTLFHVQSFLKARQFGVRAFCLRLWLFQSFLEIFLFSFPAKLKEIVGTVFGCSWFEEYHSVFAAVSSSLSLWLPTLSPIASVCASRNDTTNSFDTPRWSPPLSPSWVAFSRGRRGGETWNAHVCGMHTFAFVKYRFLDCLFRIIPCRRGLVNQFPLTSQRSFCCRSCLLLPGAKLKRKTAKKSETINKVLKSWKY